MELAEALFQANWSSSCSASEESQTMAQLLSTCSMITREPDHDPSSGLPPLFWSDHGAESSYCSYWPQGCNSIDPSSGGFLPSHDLECYNLGHPNAAREIHTTSSVWLGFCATEDAANAASLPVAAPINEETSSEDIAAGCTSANPVEPTFLASLKSSPKRKSRVHVQEADSAAIPRKKPRSLPKNGKNEQPKKTQKGVGNDVARESNIGGPYGQDARSCSSEEVSSSSQEMHGGATSLSSMSPAASDLNGKARAGRGAATDPQSLYARKRRERINERLRILQNLVPNGTKVDISTMLEEAVQYVKFLQLQIKLLSSDELWMYAPIAYNGMDIGLALNRSSLQ